MAKMLENLHGVDSDLNSAINFNQSGLAVDEIQGVLAAVYGENDEADWYWVIKKKDGTWGLGVGGCDYTGWDCQSDFSFTPASSMKAAVELAPEVELSRGRKIRAALKSQILGLEAFGVISGTHNA